MNNDPILRKCGYDPSKDFIPAPYPNAAPGEVFLPTNARMRWFSVYCEENNIHPNIDESKFEIIPGIGAGYVVATVKLTMGDQVFSSTAGRTLLKEGETYNGMSTKEYNDTVLPTCFTLAKGRCLANAGFGSGMAWNPSEDGEPAAPDAGIIIPKDTVPQIPEEEEDYPFLMTPEKTSLNAQETRNSVTDRVDLNTVRCYPVPTGMYKGKPLYEVYATDKKTFMWFDSDEFDQKNRYPEFKRMVKLYISSLPA